MAAHKLLHKSAIRQRVTEAKPVLRCTAGFFAMLDAKVSIALKDGPGGRATKGELAAQRYLNRSAVRLACEEWGCPRPSDAFLDALDGYVDRIIAATIRLPRNQRTIREWFPVH